MKLQTLPRLAMTLLLTLLLCSSCVWDKESEPDMEGNDGMVNLILKLSVNSGNKGSFSNIGRESNVATRADEVGFETPTNTYEGVNSLRIIIVRSESNNLVEYNRIVTYPEDEQLWQSLKEEKFKVAGDEWKRIYLVANEASLPAEIQQRLEKIEEGKSLSGDLRDIILTCSDETHYINNEGEEKSYIPMSEIFDIKVMEGIPGVEVDEQTETLFITRNSVKFSFTAEDENNSHLSGIKITGLKITGLGNMEYLFPRNTSYSPAKYVTQSLPDIGREILSFSVPEGADVFDYTFTPDNFGVKGTKVSADISSAYTPQVYFLESVLNEYYLTVTTDRDGAERIYENVKLPNLSLLPRNTHVKVNIVFKEENIYVQVDLLPYIGVVLYPVFGSNDVVKPPKPRESDE